MNEMVTSGSTYEGQRTTGVAATVGRTEWVAARTATLPSPRRPRKLCSRASGGLPGSVLGVTATAAMGLMLAKMNLNGEGLIFALLTVVSMTLPGGLFGWAFGRRWARQLDRDADTVSLRQWLGRLAADGAVLATVSSVGAVVSYALLAFVHSVDLPTISELGSVILPIGAAAAPAGAVTLLVCGVPFLVSLRLERRPWLAWALAAFIGPSAFVGFGIMLSQMFTLF